MSERPLLALVAEPECAAAARPLVRALAAHIDVRALARCDREPDALLVASGLRHFSGSARSEMGAEPPENDVAVARAHPSSGLARGRGCAGESGRATPVVPVVTVADGEVTCAGQRWMLRPGMIDVSAVAPRGLLVRERWRERLAKPTGWVVVTDGLAWLDRADALAWAAAAVVSGPDIVLAMALGTPIVTDRRSAEAFGLVDGQTVVIAAEDARARACELASDQQRAARLATSARQLAESSFDIGRLAVEVVAKLGLAGTCAAGPLAPLHDRLDELATPAGSPIRRRAADLTSVLIGVAP